MEYPYSIKDLATKVGKTQQSLQKFIKKNNAFVNEHTLQTGRFKMYDQAVMDLVISYYRLPQDSRETDNSDSSPAADQKTDNDAATDARIAELEAEISAKITEIEDLKAQLAKTEEERKEMIRQNGSLLLLLQEEKREKMLLLPAPKKTFRQKIAGLFRSEPAQDKKGQKNSPDAI